MESRSVRVRGGPHPTHGRRLVGVVDGPASFDVKRLPPIDQFDLCLFEMFQERSCDLRDLEVLLEAGTTNGTKT